MHELGLCEAVLQRVGERAGGRRVRSVTVRGGALLRIDPGAFEQSFRMLSSGGVADGADVTVTDVPASARCSSCSWTGDVSSADEPCRACGRLGLTLTGGDDLVLESIVYAAEEP